MERPLKRRAWGPFEGLGAVGPQPRPVGGRDVAADVEVGVVVVLTIR